MRFSEALNGALGSTPKTMFESWNPDGSQYVDFMYGFGPMVLGHSPAPVIKAIQGSLQKTEKIVR